MHNAKNAPDVFPVVKLKGYKMKKNWKQKAALAVGFVCVAAGQVASAAQDWASLGTDVDGEISAVMPVALGIMGAILAVVIGKKVLKRIAG